MALLRAPNQFTPGGAGGPVTPSCCGCCCCCCCAGSVVAAGIALPLILHQIAPKPAAATVTGEPAPDPSTASDQPTPGGPPTVRQSDRRLGILLAALAVPVAALVLFSSVALGGTAGGVLPGLALVVIVGLGIIGYHRAGVRSGGLATPVLILLIGAVVFFAELLVWLALVFGDTQPLQPVLGVLIVVAIPVLSTVAIIAAGRRRKTARPA